MDEVREKATLWLRSQRICTRCLSAPTDGVYNNCERCREKRSILQSNGVKKVNECRLIMRTIAKIEGICSQCFSHWAKKEMAQCEHCLERNRKKRTSRSRDPEGKFYASGNNYQ